MQNRSCHEDMYVEIQQPMCAEEKAQDMGDCCHCVLCWVCGRHVLCHSPRLAFSGIQVVAILLHLPVDHLLPARSLRAPGSPCGPDRKEEDPAEERGDRQAGKRRRLCCRSNLSLFTQTHTHLFHTHARHTQSGRLKDRRTKNPRIVF